jgi:predicted nucleic acid-binding protein
MTVLVVDASVLVVALVDDGPDGDLVRARLRGASIAAPELLDVEVVSVLRRLDRGGTLSPRRTAQALGDLEDLPIQRAPHVSLLRRCWELRRNLTAYDAAYVALAEALQATLLTADAPLARVPGLGCDVELVRSGPAGPATRPS